MRAIAFTGFGMSERPTPTVLHPEAVAAINARAQLFDWGIKLTVVGAVASLVGSMITAHPAGWPITLTGTALVAIGLLLALTKLPSQAFYSRLPGAQDAKGRHQCVACGDRNITRPVAARAGGLWNRPKCRCSRCQQLLYVE